MNELNEIILSIEKEKKEKETKNIRKDKKYSTKRKKIISVEEEINDWVLHLKQQLSKRNYKRAIKDIISAGLINKFKKCEGGYKIIVFYIEAKLKVIENKIFKYHINQIDNTKYKHQISHCFSYSNSISNELNLLLKSISENDYSYDNKYYNDINKRNYKIQLFDDIIRCHFDYIYTMSLLHYKIGNSMETISYLSLFLTLYKNTKLFILSYHTLHKIEKCFLLLSKIYLCNYDYENGLEFLNESIKVCFKQIIFQVQEIYYGVFIGDIHDINIREKDDLLILKDSRIKKIILNIIMIFFYKGIYNENLANIKKATMYYKQSEWFTRIFFSKNDSILYKLFNNVKKNGIEACDIINYLKEKITIYEAKLWQKKREENNRKGKNKKYTVDKVKLFNTKKFNGLVKKLQGLKIMEIDTVNKFEKNRNIKCLSSSIKDTKREGKDKNIFLSNIRLLEAYLRNDFKNIVDDMKKINLFDLDYRTRTKVLKAMNKFYFDQNQKLIRERNKISDKKVNSSKTFKFNKICESINMDKINERKLSNDNSIFEVISEGRKERNKKYDKLRINISLFKKKLNKNNSVKILLNRRNKNENESKFRSEGNSNIFSTNIYSANSPKYSKLHLTGSSSFIFNSGYNSPKKNERSKSINIKKEKENYKKKYISVTKTNKFSKNKILRENKELNEFFNVKYLKKRNYIKKLEDRDLIFQKSILKLKNTPKTSFEYFNKAESQQNADISFIKIKSLVSTRLGANDWKDNLSDEEYKEYVINNKFEKAVLNSLDTKALYNYKMNKKRVEKMKEEKEILEDSSKFDRKYENINNTNKKALNDLNNQLNRIYESELKRDNDMINYKKKLNRQIYKKFKLDRTKSALSRSKIKDNFYKKEWKF